MKFMMLEMDRILRPGGRVIIREASYFADAVATIGKGMRWICHKENTEYDAEKEKIVICQKKLWQPSNSGSRWQTHEPVQGWERERLSRNRNSRSRETKGNEFESLLTEKIDWFYHIIYRPRINQVPSLWNEETSNSIILVLLRYTENFLIDYIFFVILYHVYQCCLSIFCCCVIFNFQVKYYSCEEIKVLNHIGVLHVHGRKHLNQGNFWWETLTIGNNLLGSRKQKSRKRTIET